MAKRPPSRGTRGRRSGGMTGIVVRIIHSGWLPDLRKASTTLQALGELFLLGVGGGFLQVGPELRIQAVEVDFLEERADRLGADAGHEAVAPYFSRHSSESLLGEELPFLEGRVLRVQDHVGLEVEDLLQILEGHVEHVADPARAGSSGTRCGPRGRPARYGPCARGGPCDWMTSTPHFSQTTPRCFMRLYLPQLHS